MPTPPQGSLPSLRACSQDALQLRLPTPVALLSFPTPPSCRGSGCCTYPVMNTAPSPHVHSAHSHSHVGWGAVPEMLRGRAGHTGAAVRMGRLRIPDSSPGVAPGSTMSAQSSTLPRCSAGPVSCLLLSLVHLSTFLHTSALPLLSIVDFRSLYALLPPCRPSLQPSSFSCEKDCVIFHISWSKGDFIPKWNSGASF